MNVIGQNPQVPYMDASTFIPDQLIAGNLKLVTQQIRLASGNLPRGAVLGQISNTSFSTAAGAANAGNGTIGSVSEGANVNFGVYTLTAKSATKFAVVDPTGIALPDATVGTAYANEINFTLTAGGTAFAAGDTFTIEVFDATGDFVLSEKTASNGSQVPSAILVTATDATTGAQVTSVYVLGEFNGNALTFDPSWTLQDLIPALRTHGIFVKSAVSAADPA